MKSTYVLWLILGVFSYTLALEHLYFGGTEEESRQAEYYLNVDSGTNAGPTDELIRTQRSFWKLLKQGIFGEYRNCCHNCNYNTGNCNNYNLGNSLLRPLQSCRLLPLWRPFQPLFSKPNYKNLAANNNGCENSNNFANPLTPSINTYSNNGINTFRKYDNSELSAPAPIFKTLTELPHVEPDYQLDYSPGYENTYESPSEPEKQTPTNSNFRKLSQKSKVSQVIYQPMNYVSPQYLEQKPLNEAIKQDVRTYGEMHTEEHPQLSSYEFESNDRFKLLYNSIENQIKLTDSNNYKQKSIENEVEIPHSQTISCTESSVSNLNNPSTNPPVSLVSTVNNIMAPSLLHSLSQPNVPCADGDPSIVQDYIGSLPTLSVVAEAPEGTSTTLSYFHPILLTSDDQPYRACPELFEDYQHKLSTFLHNMYKPN